MDRAWFRAFAANYVFDREPPKAPTLLTGQIADGDNVYGEPIQFSPFGIDGGYDYVTPA